MVGAVPCYITKLSWTKKTHFKSNLQNRSKAAQMDPGSILFILLGYNLKQVRFSMGCAVRYLTKELNTSQSHRMLSHVTDCIIRLTQNCFRFLAVLPPWTKRTNHLLWIQQNVMIQHCSVGLGVFKCIGKVKLFIAQIKWTKLHKLWTLDKICTQLFIRCQDLCILSSWTTPFFKLIHGGLSCFQLPNPLIITVETRNFTKKRWSNSASSA